MQNFKNLTVYEESKKLALNMYRLTSKFPDNERFGIVQQLRRATTSIGANIAEGTGRGSNSDFLRFLYHSMGSLKEVEHFLLIAKELKYISEEEFEKTYAELERLAKMLNTFMRKVALTTNH